MNRWFYRLPKSRMRQVALLNMFVVEVCLLLTLWSDTVFDGENAVTLTIGWLFILFTFPIWWIVSCFQFVEIESRIVAVGFSTLVIVSNAYFWGFLHSQLVRAVQWETEMSDAPGDHAGCHCWFIQQ